MFKEWWFNKVNILILSQIIIHKNSDGSTKWTSFSYLKSLYTKTVMVQQSKHLSPISNHYTQKQWWFNKVNIFLLSQIIIHKNSDGSTKWTSFSYLKSLYTKTVMVQQSEHPSPISNHYTQKQWWFNKVNIFLLSQIIIHKNSDGSTKWTSFSYLKSLYTKTVTVQQSEHLYSISLCTKRPRYKPMEIQILTCFWQNNMVGINHLMTFQSSRSWLLEYLYTINILLHKCKVSTMTSIS